MKNLPMIHGDKPAFDVVSKSKKLFEKASPIVFEGKTYKLYFAGDLYRTYSDLGGKIDFTQFWKLFFKLPNYSVFCTSNPVNTIICRKADVNKKIIWKVIDEKNRGKQSYEIVEDSDENLLSDEITSTQAVKSMVTGPKNPPSVKSGSNLSKGPSLDTRGIPKSKESIKPVIQTKRAAPVGASEDKGNVKRIQKDTAAFDQQTTLSKTIYDELSSSEDIFQGAPSKFKSPLEPEKPKAEVKSGFEQMKLRIIHAFGNGCIIPISGFTGAMCLSGAGAFDYRKAGCNIPKHAHSNLTSFLRCYKDIITTKVLKSSYGILNTQTATKVNQKRLSLFSVPITDIRYPYFTEVLCVNIFSAKFTVFLGDFLELFEQAYGVKLDSFAGQMAKDFLNNIGSPNIRVLNNRGVYSLALTPTGDPSYKDWMPPAIWEDVLKQERRVFGEHLPEQKDLQAKVNVNLEKIFPGCDDKVKELMKIADFNLPKMVQDVNVNQSAANNLAFTPLWKILRHSINFDDKTTFFSRS